MGSPWAKVLEGFTPVESAEKPVAPEPEATPEVVPVEPSAVEPEVKPKGRKAKQQPEAQA